VKSGNASGNKNPNFDWTIHPTNAKLSLKAGLVALTIPLQRKIGVGKPKS
jgi:hypothetical protein